MEPIKAAVDQLFNGEYNDFKDSVKDVLMNKLNDRIDTERYSVGQAMFADEAGAEETDIDQEEYSNEEV